MIRNLFLLIFTFYVLYGADEINLNDFEIRQTILQDIKKVVQSEESIARAYEQYILDNYEIPSLMTQLYNTNYLGTSSDFLGTITGFSTNFNTFVLGLSKLSYALNDTLKADSGIKALYEGNSFRKRTYYRNSEIYFVLEDAFAKHLFDLIQQKGSGLSTCVGLANVSCVNNNHIYIKPTYTSSDITGYFMAYHIDNFKAGPIVITNDTTLYSSPEFNSIAKGSLLIDRDGLRYVKTTSGIEALQ
ncbi:MAG: hypothetical protein U5K55_05775 [Aliarcobacter sp.]|nr:hypothetical protein [Aliarcobacter sp.]